jgi:cyanophycinase-like exopeptidase
MKTIFTFLLSVTFTAVSIAQDYTSYLTGDPTDLIVENHQSGLLLAGGATDDDNGMIWFLNRGGGGDVLVIRASGSDGYNDYLYEELGVNVNSVETIVFHNANAANDEYVLQQIAGAELLFIAGGDQYDYYQYWKDSPVEDAINALINDKQITVGGTSAGMAILANCYYTPPGSSADAEEALGNPFHPDVNILGRNDFLDVPFMENVITDTHYDQRERAGRHLTFLARLSQEHNVQMRGIAANEYNAVAVDENGMATAFGEWPEYPEDVVYFLRTNCQTDYLPELMQEGEALTWTRGGAAVKAYRMPGTPTGEFTFDLNDWETGNGGTWYNWTAEDGVLSQDETEISDCLDGMPSDIQNIDNQQFDIFPNPAYHALTIDLKEKSEVRIYDISGKNLAVFSGENRVYLNVNDWEAGMYFVEVKSKNASSYGKFVKAN